MNLKSSKRDGQGKWSDDGEGSSSSSAESNTSAARARQLAEKNGSIVQSDNPGQTSQQGKIAKKVKNLVKLSKAEIIEQMRTELSQYKAENQQLQRKLDRFYIDLNQANSEKVFA